MTIKQRLESDLNSALKARQAERVACLRMLRSKILEREVELRGAKGRDHQLEDEEVLRVISAYAKQRRDSIESFRRAGREELAVREEAELEIVSGYLPRQLDPEAIARIVDEAIAESGATSPRELGQVMKLVMPRLQGAADGKLVNRIVREKLQPAE